jgi:hypothetical protein
MYGAEEVFAEYVLQRPVFKVRTMGTGSTATEAQRKALGLGPPTKPPRPNHARSRR